MFFKTLSLLFAIGLSAAPRLQAAPLPDTGACCRALDLHALSNLDALMPRLLDKRVIFVGETHDHFEDHLAQLEIIRRVHAAQPDMVIAMEPFQQTSQPVLDDYIAGRIDEASMLRRTDYFNAWRFDYRLYRPILIYAREHRIPVLALNVPTDISHKVAHGGFASLTDAERRWVPADINRDNARYRDRIFQAFQRHPDHVAGSFDSFLEAQLLWDEGMAARAADYLQRHPGRAMVLIAGNGHIRFGDGIPGRLIRRLPVPSVIVMNGTADEMLSPGLADIVLFPEPQALPAAGKLGVLANDDQAGVVRVDSLDENGAASAAGVVAGDVLLAIDKQPLSSMADLRIALLNKMPGDTVTVTVRRKGWLFNPARDWDIAVTLR
jgi:uncharacterized iron-regulated protein